MTAARFLRERLARAIEREDWPTVARLWAQLDNVLNGSKKAAA